MNQDQFKDRLLAREQEALTRIQRAMNTVRESGDGAAQDAGDESVTHLSKETQFAGVEDERTVLNQVRDALARIEDGSFGTCVVDGGPIEPARLAAIPWTPYCLKHQEEIEAAEPVRTPTI
jgi:DnaK suppressor protein